MGLRRAIITVCILPLYAGAATAQAPAAPPPQQQQQQQEPPCVQEFVKLRADVEKKAGAIRAASERKAHPREACQLFNVFIAAQTKMLKYAADNSVWCGIPTQVVANLKTGITKTSEIRTKVCQAAAAPVQQTGPTLSDALTSPVPNSNNIKTGRGTFDTLTGSPIGK
jgi:hypothetical protein